MTVAVRPQRPAVGASTARPTARPVRARRAAVAQSGALPYVLLIPTMLMVSVLAFRVHEAVPAISSILRPAVLFGTGGLIFLLARSNAVERARIKSDQMVKSTALYLLWAMATIPTALFIGGGIQTIKIIYTILFIAIAFAMIPPSERALNWLVGAMAFVGAVTGAMAIVQNNSWMGRLSFGGSMDANDLAAVMSLSTALALGAARKAGGIGKLVFLVCAAVTAGVVFKTGSRGGFLSLLLAAAVFVLAVPGFKRVIWLGLAACGILTFWFTAPQATRDRFTTLTDLSKDYNSTAYFGREEIWKRGLGYAITNPLFGVGLGNFEVAEGESIARDGWHGKWSTAHNAYILAAAELGIPGFAIFMMMMWRTVRSAFRWTPFERQSGVPPDRMRPELLAAVLGMAGAIYFLSFAYSWVVFAIFSLVHLAERTRLATTRPAVPARR